MQQHHYVDVLRSFKDKQFYVGFTKNLTARVETHNNGWVPSTKNRLPLQLVKDRLGKAIRENEAQELSKHHDDLHPVLNRGGKGRR